MTYDFGDYSSTQNQIMSQCKIYSNSNLSIDNCISVLHINARSLKNKFDDFQTFLFNSGVDWTLICVSETWLKDELLQYYSLENYNLFASCRSDGEGGGAAIYVNNKYEAKEIRDLDSMHLQSVFIELKLKTTNIISSIVIGEIYKPPNFSHTNFLAYLESILDVVEKNKKVCLLVGDFNYNLFDVNNSKQTLSFLNLMNSYGNFPTISLATRHNNQSSTLLDNIFTNDLSLVKDSGVIVEDLSDHFPVFLTLNLKPNKHQDRIYKTIFDKRKVNELNDFIIEKLKFFQRNTDANAACTELIQTYTDGINTFSKNVKYSRRKTPIKPWITPSILCCINKKTKLYKIYIHKKSLETEIKYKHYRNILTNVMRDAKRLYYHSLFHENKNNSRKTWETLNEIINRNKKDTLAYPSQFLDIHGNVYDEDQIAEGFNNFFSTIGSNLEKNIPAPNNSPINYLRNPTYEPFNTNLITTSSEVVTIIKSLNPVGGGLDKISTKILLLTYEKCISHLTYFFNLCLRTCVFPNLLKIAVVVPIFKSGEKNKFNNYRPISLLPVFSKILEKIIHSRLLDYLNTNNILNPLQFGFRKKT